MSAWKIPFNRPCFLGNEFASIQKSIEQNGHIAGSGPFTQLCEKLLTDLYQAPVLLTSSCTHALEMAALLLEIQDGDEVIVPSYTFVSTANAFALRGARIRFAECDPFGNMDLDHCDQLIGPKTKAVCVVHYAGCSPDMDRLAKLCQSKNVALVEDAAQSIFAKYQSKQLGGHGSLSCISFHETKNVTSGEGGALVINDPSLLERAKIIRDKGTNRSQFLQGLVDKYTWVDIGSSYVMSDLNAAFLYPQLLELEAITVRRQELWNRYIESLAEPLKGIGAEILLTPDWNTPNYHLFGIILPSESARGQFIAALKEVGIMAPFHYVALHRSPFGMAHSQSNLTAFKNCDMLSSRLVRLPLFFNLTDIDQQHVIDAVIQWIKTHKQVGV